MNATIAIAAGFGLLLTIAGALGAHAIPPESADLRESWDSALLFGFVHVLAAIAARLFSAERPIARYAGWAFLFGVATFSLALVIATVAKAATPAGTDPNWLSHAGGSAPVGGIAFMLGWALMAFGALKPATS